MDLAIHFVLAFHEEDYRFDPGSYEIDLIADVVGRRRPMELATINLSLTGELADVLARKDGVLFERKVGGAYEGHQQARTKAP